MRNKPWTIPVIILILLIFAWNFRWSYEASKTFDNQIVKWKTDRWTGQNWIEVYTFATQRQGPKVTERPIEPYVANYFSLRGKLNQRDVIQECREYMESSWKIAVSATVLWLIYLLFMKEWIKNRKEKQRSQQVAEKETINQNN